MEGLRSGEMVTSPATSPVSGPWRRAHVSRYDHGGGLAA
jgi:hypothetical protein